MSMTLTLYNQLPSLLAMGDLDWEVDTLKLALVSSSYTFSAEHTQFADVSAYEVTGTNYTAGGAILSGASVTRSGTVTSLDADDVPFSDLAATFRGGVLYKSGSAGGLTNPLLAYILFDDTPADITATAGYPITWDSAGIFKATL